MGKKSIVIFIPNLKVLISISHISSSPSVESFKELGLVLVARATAVLRVHVLHFRLDQGVHPRPLSVPGVRAVEEGVDEAADEHRDGYRSVERLGEGGSVLPVHLRAGGLARATRDGLVAVHVLS